MKLEFKFDTMIDEENTLEDLDAAFDEEDTADEDSLDEPTGDDDAPVDEEDEDSAWGGEEDDDVPEMPYTDDEDDR